MEMIKKFSLTLIIIAVAGVAVAALTVFKPHAERVAVEEKLPVVTVFQADAGSVEIPVYSRGIVKPGTEIYLTAEVQGRIEEVSESFASGGSFKRGEVLLRIDPINYELDISKAKSQVASAKLNVERVKADVRANKQAQSKVGKARIEEAQAQLAAAKADLTRVKLLLDRTEIRAPFDGRVRETAVDKGQYITPGVQVARIYATDVAEIRLPLSDRQAGLVEVPRQYEGESLLGQGSPVMLKANYGEEEYFWPGTIVRAEGGVSEINRLKYVVAEVSQPFARDANQPDRPPLDAGKFVEVEIAGKKFHDVVVLPREVIRNANQVWTIDANQRLKINEVDILHRGREEIYIRDGINDGELVVLTQLDVAIEGMRVQVANEDMMREAMALNSEEQSDDNNTNFIDSGNVAIGSATKFKDPLAPNKDSQQIIIEEAEPPAPLLEND